MLLRKEKYSRELHLDFISRENQMYLVHLCWIYLDVNEEPCNASTVFVIKQFWIWNLLYGRSK